MYQGALKLHKIATAIFEEQITTENVRELNQMVYTGRQANFMTLRYNVSKIGMNTTANKLYHLSGKIGYEALCRCQSAFYYVVLENTSFISSFPTAKLFLKKRLVASCGLCLIIFTRL